MASTSLNELDIYLTEMIELLVEGERARRFDKALEGVCKRLSAEEADLCRQEIARAAAHWGAFVIDTAIALSGFVYRQYGAHVAGEDDRSRRAAV